MAESSVHFFARCGFRAYQTALYENNRVDFAHLQRIAYDLLENDALRDDLTKDIRYVLVDEYQDTNAIQEQLLFKLTERSGNLCVVGDEDQSLYRFRGATVRNILEFPQRFPNCPIIKLTLNYRSHPDIIERYDHWMASIDWSNPDGASFRYNKSIKPAPDANAHSIRRLLAYGAKIRAMKHGDLPI
jgi:DNA helicase-2/ATP-dependent DNA helicase PcrA